jgi:DNA-binding PadR family transcriptional regulator
MNSRPRQHRPRLPIHEFYALLALAGEPLHAYGIMNQMENDSLGAVTLHNGQIYSLITRLENKALIDPAGPMPAGPSGKPRQHYELSIHGGGRLKTTLQPSSRRSRSPGLAG